MKWQWWSVWGRTRACSHFRTHHTPVRSNYFRFRKRLSSTAPDSRKVPTNPPLPLATHHKTLNLFCTEPVPHTHTPLVDLFSQPPPHKTLPAHTHTSALRVLESAPQNPSRSHKPLLHRQIPWQNPFWPDCWNPKTPLRETLTRIPFPLHQ